MWSTLYYSLQYKPLPSEKDTFLRTRRDTLIPSHTMYLDFSCEFVKETFVVNYKSNLSGGGTLINQSEHALR